MLLVVNYLKISLPVNFILRQMRGESFWLTPFGESFWWVILKRAQIYSICNSRCIAQVLDCLAHIHTNNVIHRDLKVAYNPIYWKKVSHVMIRMCHVISSRVMWCIKCLFNSFWPYFYRFQIAKNVKFGYSVWKESMFDSLPHRH